MYIRFHGDVNALCLPHAVVVDGDHVAELEQRVKERDTVSVLC